MKQFWSIVKDYIRIHKWLFGVSIALYLITAMLAMLPAKILQLTIDIGFMKSDVSALVLCIVALLLTHAVKAALTYLSNKGMINFGNGLLKRLRVRFMIASWKRICPFTPKTKLDILTLE